MKQSEKLREREMKIHRLIAKLVDLIIRHETLVEKESKL